MRDNAVSISKLITATLWALSGVIMALSWGLYYMVSHQAAIMVATTAILIVAAAATSQVRCYMLRICGLLRATSDIESIRNVAPFR